MLMYSFYFIDFVFMRSLFLFVSLFFPPLFRQRILSVWLWENVRLRWTIEEVEARRTQGFNLFTDDKNDRSVRGKETHLCLLHSTLNIYPGPDILLTTVSHPGNSDVKKLNFILLVCHLKWRVPEIILRNELLEIHFWCINKITWRVKNRALFCW